MLRIHPVRTGDWSNPRVGWAPLAAAAVLSALAGACTKSMIPDIDSGHRDGGTQLEVDAGPPCSNGVRDGDESHVDCGGSCGPCSTGAN